VSTRETAAARGKGSKSSLRQRAAALVLVVAAPIASGAPPSGTTFTLCGEPQTLQKAMIDVYVGVYGPKSGTPGNPVARHGLVRVGYGLELSTLPEARRGEDGGIEPELALFEPLVPGTDHYYLPWNLPAGLRLADTGEWGGWDAWLGNDNAQLDENTLEFLRADPHTVRVRWEATVLDRDDCRMLFEGDVAIGEVMLGVDSDVEGEVDIDAVLDQVFGMAQRQGSEVLIEHPVDKWTGKRGTVARLRPRVPD
jgi:hypothetical protein